MSTAPDKKMRVALIGSRGIPASYGGYETLMEELSRRLVERNIEVTVYCRSHYTPRDLKEHNGAELVVLPTVRGKYFDTPVHTLLSCLHAARRGYDAVLVVNSANAPFLPILKARGIPMALNVDGIEKRRAKWGPFGRMVYAVSERLATRWPTILLTDADTIRDHYLERYGAKSTVITYGVEPEALPAGETLARLGLESRRYFLYVSRFERENNPHRIAEAYRQVGGDLPLVMVGGAPYANSFIRSFTEGADRRVIFPGAIYGDGYRELLSHALAYIQATEVGGTHPALVEAMGYGNALLVHDTPENREVAGDPALYFDAYAPETFAAQATKVLEDETIAKTMRDRSAQRASELYSWDHVSDLYVDLFQRLADSRG